MPRANRYFLPGYVWHITHRCHQRNFLLKFARDRRRYLRWLFEAKKRFGLCVLDYIVTSNHIHLLVNGPRRDCREYAADCGTHRAGVQRAQRAARGLLGRSISRQRLSKLNEHLHRCLVYIDFNMVRAGVAGHPGQWKESGFSEIQDPPKRYRIVDLRSLSDVSGFVNLEDFQRAHREWNEQRLENGLATRHDQWSEAIAVGSLGFVEQVKRQLGIRAMRRDLIGAEGSYALRESHEAYGVGFIEQIEPLSSANALLWNESIHDLTT